MHNMRKLMEMVEASPTATGPQGRLLPNELDSDLQNGKYKRVPLYKYGKHDGFKLVNVKTGKVKRVREDSVDIQHPDYEAEELQDQIKILRGALKLILDDVERKYREGDYEYQFAILAREALNRT